MATDKKINAIYTIFENDIQENDVDYSDELKNELDERQAAYKNGSAKVISAKESQERIQQKLKAASKKWVIPTFYFKRRKLILKSL